MRIYGWLASSSNSLIAALCAARCLLNNAWEPVQPGEMTQSRVPSDADGWREQRAPGFLSQAAWFLYFFLAWAGRESQRGAQGGIALQEYFFPSGLYTVSSISAHSPFPGPRLFSGSVHSPDSPRFPPLTPTPSCSLFKIVSP